MFGDGLVDRFGVPVLVFAFVGSHVALAAAAAGSYILPFPNTIGAARAARGIGSLYSGRSRRHSIGHILPPNQCAEALAAREAAVELIPQGRFQSIAAHILVLPGGGRRRGRRRGDGRGGGVESVRHCASRRWRLIAGSRLLSAITMFLPIPVALVVLRAGPPAAASSTTPMLFRCRR